MLGILSLRSGHRFLTWIVTAGHPLVELWASSLSALGIGFLPGLPQLGIHTLSSGHHVVELWASVSYRDCHRWASTPRFAFIILKIVTIGARGLSSIVWQLLSQTVRRHRAPCPNGASTRLHRNIVLGPVPLNGGLVAHMGLEISHFCLF